MKSLFPFLLFCGAAASGQVKDSVTLREVDLRGKTQVVKQQVDRAVIVVGPQVRRIADNALDILKLAPGVTISDNDDALRIAGKSAVEVLLDGKLVRLAGRDLLKLLKTLPASSVSRVEVLTTPPSRYDTDGNTGLLNILTRAGGRRGFTGSTDASLSHGKRAMADVSGLFNYGTRAVAVSSYLAWHSGNYETRYVENRLLPSGALNAENVSVDRWKDPVVRITADLRAGDRQTISALAEREVSRNAGTYTTASERYLAVGENPNRRHWQTYNLNYRFADTLGTGFTLDGDRSLFAKNDRSLVSSQSARGASVNDYLTLTRISITTLKGDWSHARTNGWKTDAGFKISAVRTENGLSGVIEQSFAYRENVGAMYVDLGRDFGAWSLQAGLRGEHTSAQGVADVPGGRLHRPDTAYLSFLPSVFLSWAARPQHSFRLALSRRIKRPDYRDLQPFEYEIDPLDRQLGNPLLRVQRTVGAELTYTYEDRLTLTAAYTRTLDYVNPVIALAGDVSYESPQNAGRRDDLGVDVNYPVQVSGKWEMINKAGIHRNRFAGSIYGGTLDEAQWSATVSTSQRLTLPHQLVLQLSARYATASRDVIYRQGANANVSTSVSRKLFGGKGSVRVGMSDLFRMQKNTVTVDFSALRYTRLNTWESRRISAAVNWRFGRGEARGTRDRETGNGEERERSGK